MANLYLSYFRQIYPGSSPIADHFLSGYLNTVFTTSRLYKERSFLRQATIPGRVVVGIRENSLNIIVSAVFSTYRVQYFLCFRIAFLLSLQGRDRKSVV